MFFIQAYYNSEVLDGIDTAGVPIKEYGGYGWTSNKRKSPLSKGSRTVYPNITSIARAKSPYTWYLRVGHSCYCSTFTTTPSAVDISSTEIRSYVPEASPNEGKNTTFTKHVYMSTMREKIQEYNILCHTMIHR